MENTYSPPSILTYIRNNWFKISLIALVIFACVRKNLVFDVKLKGSNQSEIPSGSFSKSSSKETLTFNEAGKEELSKSSLKIPLFGGSQTNTLTSELAVISDTVKMQYLKRFAKVAVGEQKKYKIPASIILATALTQSFAGKRDVALSGNNHFGLMCSNDWQGARGIHQGECYRVYESAWSSFRDNSLYISSIQGNEMTSLQAKGYKTWAKALESAGYLETKGLAETLIRVIEYYQLDQLDQL